MFWLTRMLVWHLQYNVMKDYESWSLHRDYHHLLVGADSEESALTSESTLLTPGVYYIGVTNTDETVLSSILARWTPSIVCMCVQA